jgi:hypothetical protein
MSLVAIVRRVSKHFPGVFFTPLVVAQRVVAIISFIWFNSIVKLRKSFENLSLVVGPYEVAFMIHNISGVLPNTTSVNLGERSRENYNYDYILPFAEAKFSSLVRVLYGPYLLGKLMARNRSFIYVGRLGFLISAYDNREWEFRFLKNRDKKIITYLVGSDIRSPKCMQELQVLTGEENIGSYQFSNLSPLEFAKYDGNIKRFASIINAYSDLIFTAKFDQASYLKKETQPFLYFCPDSFFERNSSKFQDLQLIKVVHAPTNTTIKGTNLVRAAVKRLILEGYRIEFREIQNMKNQDLQEVLKDTHILLNEFYGFMPGVLAIEGMAKSCVVLTRADFTYENDLGVDSRDAWITTPPYYIYDNLKYCLDNPEKLWEQSERGYLWAYKNARASISGRKLLDKLSVL